RTCMPCSLNCPADGFVVDHLPDPPLRTCSSGEHQRLLLPDLRGGHIRLPVRNSSRRFERVSAGFGKFIATRKAEHGLDARTAFAQVAAHLPEAPQRRRQSQRLFGARVRDAPVERGSEVVMVKLQAVELRLTLV